MTRSILICFFRNGTEKGSIRTPESPATWRMGPSFDPRRFFLAAGFRFGRPDLPLAHGSLPWSDPNWTMSGRSV